MTTPPRGATHPHSSARASQAADGTRIAPGRRRSLPLVAAGILCVFAGALVFGAVSLGSGSRQAVLTVGRAVPAGAVIGEADLRTTRVSGGEGLALVPATERPAIVGKVAAVALAPGTLLARSQLGSGVAVAPGRAVVGLGLKEGRVPSGLRPGDAVMVVDTGTTGAGTPTTSGVVLVPSATVFTVPQAPDPSGAIVVSVVVGAFDAPRIAAAAAAERVSLVLLGPPS